MYACGSHTLVWAPSAGHDSTIANAFADAESSPVVSGARNISRTQRQSLSRTHSGCLQASPIIAAAPRAASMSRLGLSDAGCARELYAAVCPAMVARLALLPSPVRTHEEVALGCLSAPAGLVAPVFCNVHGVETLLAWEKVLQERFMRSTTPHIATPAAVTLQGYEGGADGRASAGGASSLAAARGGVHSSAAGPAAARACVVQVALAMLRDAATAAARRHGGYVVASSADGGHWVLVFGCAEAAVGWGLDMLQAMLTAEWPDGFLEHELTEEAWEGEATGQALCGRATDCAVGSRSLGLLFVTSHRRAAREARSASSHRCGLRPGHGASGAPQRPTGLRGKTHEPGSAHRGEGEGGVGECPGGLGLGVAGGRGQGNGRERQYRYPDSNRHVIPPCGDRSCW